MYYEFKIALKHMLTRKGRGLSLVNLLAIAGVALGVSSLIGGLGITAGFEDSFRGKILGVTSHIFARPYSTVMYDRQTLKKQIKDQVKDVVGVSETAYHKAVFSGVGGTTGGMIKSIIPADAAQVIKLADYMKEGTLDSLTPHANPMNIIIGAQLADRLQAKVGDYITALATQVKKQGNNEWTQQKKLPNTIPFKVVGIFQAGYDEYDTRFTYAHLEDTENLFGKHEGFKGYEIAVKDPQKASEIVPQVEDAILWGLGGPLDWAEFTITDPLRANRIATRTTQSLQVQDWYQQNPTLYVSLLYQRLAILVVLSVMLILAACNVSSMMIMMSLERTRDIAILKAMGATHNSIRLIFILEGLVVAILGSLLGVLLGFFFCEILLGHGISLDAKVYGIDHFPVHTNWMDYIYAMIISLVIIGIAVFFPARRAALLKPTDGLREDQLDTV